MIKHDVNFWAHKKVLITGATGLIGGWLTRKLVEHGANITILVRDWVPDSHVLSNQELHQSVVTVRGCVEDQTLMERVLGEHEIEVIFHLAAQTIVQIANRNPVSTFKSNIEGTWSLLEAARRSPNVQSIAIASSDKAYGDSEILPYSETTPLNAIYPYDVSKACADMIARSYAVTYNLPIGITRCGNFYGGGDLNWSRIIPGTIRSILMNENPILRSNGQLQRDYIFVEDAVHAYMTLAEQLTSNKNLRGEAFNFSTQDPLTALEIVESILDVMPESKNLRPVIEATATGEILAQSLDATKARKLLNWQPQYQLVQSLEKTVEWYRAYLLAHNTNKV